MRRCWMYAIRVKGARREVVRFVISTACMTILDIVRNITGIQDIRTKIVIHKIQESEIKSTIVPTTMDTGTLKTNPILMLVENIDGK